MKVLKRNDISSFDVDGTLVVWPKNPNKERPGTIKLIYGNETVYLYPHLPHIRFLKNCFLRGDYIEVWSKNGYVWAENVVRNLHLEDFVDIVRSKPARHIDDKTTLEEIVGGRVYMPYDPEDDND